jgi:molybdate transport system substrate-binding protein
LKDSKNAGAAKEFVQFLSSDPAKAVFEKHGFIMTR